MTSKKKPKRDPLAGVKRKHPGPWSVYVGQLRPQFPTRIVCVRDANGKEVMPWGGFDQMRFLTHREKVALARAIARFGRGWGMTEVYRIYRRASTGR
ncbi:MAG: hypothetical protein JNK21_08785 [Rhodospirillaceae bacterium]|nr:hypothetical protein [Rhodospirillaceae bacterium]